jgi:hypothetical protein
MGELWSQAIKSGVQDPLLSDLEDVVVKFAGDDWGTGTKVVFNRAQRSMRVLNGTRAKELSWE